MESKDAVAQWVEVPLEEKIRKRLFRSKKLLVLAKEKEQQRAIFSILLFYLQEERDQLWAQGLMGKEI